MKLNLLTIHNHQYIFQVNKTVFDMKFIGPKGPQGPRGPHFRIVFFPSARVNRARG